MKFINSSTKLGWLGFIFLLVFLTASEAEIRGNYLEARSVDVYVGACHFGSEYVEGGKEATLIWQITSGIWNNVSLDRLIVVAVVSANQNLDLKSSIRQSVIYLDRQVTTKQRKAVVDLLQKKRSAILGKIVAVKQTIVDLSNTGRNYQLTVSQQQLGDVLVLDVSQFPCTSCTQPHQIWYDPLEKIDKPILGKSQVYRYQDKILSVMWNFGLPTNNIFVGQFVM